MDFAADVYMSEAQNPIPPPPPRFTVYLYTYLHREGEEGGELTQREGDF